MRRGLHSFCVRSCYIIFCFVLIIYLFAKRIYLIVKLTCKYCLNMIFQQELLQPTITTTKLYDIWGKIKKKNEKRSEDEEERDSDPLYT